jgi:hypothetical protein
VSADTVVPDQKNSQDWNRYSYVRNNPVKYIDPTGYRTECYGTDAFISESDNDGGISWASCWARQRDIGILTQLGAKQEEANEIAAQLDQLGLAGFLQKTQENELTVRLTKAQNAQSQNCPTCTIITWAYFTDTELGRLSRAYESLAWMLVVVGVIAGAECLPCGVFFEWEALQAFMLKDYFKLAEAEAKKRGGVVGGGVVAISLYYDTSYSPLMETYYEGASDSVLLTPGLVTIATLKWKIEESNKA